jgi:hypothetical protein
LKLEINPLQGSKTLSQPAAHAYFALARFKLMLNLSRKPGTLVPIFPQIFDPVVSPLKASEVQCAPWPGFLMRSWFSGTPAAAKRSHCFEKPDPRIKLEAKWVSNSNKIIGFHRRKMPKVQKNTCSDPCESPERLFTANLAIILRKTRNEMG